MHQQRSVLGAVETARKVTMPCFISLAISMTVPKDSYTVQVTQPLRYVWLQYVNWLFALRLLTFEFTLRLFTFSGTYVYPRFLTFTNTYVTNRHKNWAYA